MTAYILRRLWQMVPTLAGQVASAVEVALGIPIAIDKTLE
jgi:ABC-type microcin C transport system permease subunit YejB